MRDTILRLKGVTASVPGDSSTEGKIYVTKVVDNEPIFGSYEDAIHYKKSEAWDVESLYNRTHNKKLETVDLPSHMEKNLSYICDIKGYAHVINSAGKSGNILFIIGACINSLDKNTAKMSYSIEMFKKEQADYLRESYNDYSTAVDRYNQLSTEWDWEFGKYSHLSKK